MATSDSDWKQAKALFEAGKSFRDIEKEIGISRASLNRTSKKEGWQKGELRQLVSSMAQDRVAFETLEPAQKEIVSQLVDDESERILYFKKKREKIADLAYQRIEKSLLSCEDQHVKSLVEAADKVNVMVETAPRFNPNSTTINNVNAQQNNGGEKPSILVRFVDNDKDVIDGEAGELSEQVSEYISAAPL